MKLEKLRRYAFHLRKNGIQGLIKFYKLDKFSEKIFTSKKLKWNTLGYWQVDPMPTEKELYKFYSELYWLNNSYYKKLLITARDIYHLKFLENNLQDKIVKNSNFMNFGAGHGGISYLMASKNLNVINIEPSEIFSGNLEKFSNYNNLDDFINNAKNYKKIDVLYSSHTLEHLPDPIEFFKKISPLLDENAKVVIEVPNCIVSKITPEYSEGGCDGKAGGSHLIYFTKDFFENLNADISFFIVRDNETKHLEVENENNADCIRAIISAKSIKNWIR